MDNQNEVNPDEKFKDKKNLNLRFPNIFVWLFDDDSRQLSLASYPLF